MVVKAPRAGCESRTTNDLRPTTSPLAHCRGFRYRPSFDSLLKQLTLENSLHVHAWCMHQVGIECSRFDQVFDFGDGDLGRGGHHGIEIARGLPIDKVAPFVAFPRLDEGKVGLQSAFHQVRAAVELACFFAVGDDGSYSGGREERWNAGATRTNSLGKRSLRNEFELQSAGQHHLFEQFVFPDVGSYMAPNLAIGEKQSHAHAINTDVIADGGKVFGALAGEGADQVLGHAAQPESTNHDGGSLKHVLDRLVGARDNFVHGRRILSEISLGEHFQLWMAGISAEARSLTRHHEMQPTVPRG